MVSRQVDRSHSLRTTGSSKSRLYKRAGTRKLTGGCLWEGPRSSHGRTYGVYFRTAMPALVGALCVFTVVTFSYITDVRPQLVASWDAVVQDYPDRNLATVRV